MSFSLYLQSVIIRYIFHSSLTYRYLNRFRYRHLTLRLQIAGVDCSDDDDDDDVRSQSAPDAVTVSVFPQCIGNRSNSRATLQSMISDKAYC